MLKIIVIISFFTLLSTKIFPQNFWEKIDSPTSKRLNSLVFIDSINGWVAGDSGLIIHTSNGGLDWETQYSNDSLRVVNIFFLNDQIGWCSALSEFYEPYGTYILKTTNGGEDWSSEYFRIENSFVNSFYLLDSLTGFAVGYPQIFHRTTDGGLSWSHVNLDSATVSDFPPYSIKFYSPQLGYACGGAVDIAGVVWKTIDGGLNWSTVVDTITSEIIYDIHLFDSLHIIAIGGDPEYGASTVVSTDGGNTWEYNYLEVFWFPINMAFRKNTEGWAPMGGQKKFLYSADSGENWVEVNTPDSTSILRVCFPDTLHGYGIGAQGNIVKYVYQVPTNLLEEEETISDFYLLQNYPNPFNPSTTITYSIPENGFVKLTIFTLLGEEVVTIVNKFQKADRYEVDFNAVDLSSGIYIYKIESNNYSASKKLVVLK
jgi:photosystem II stability/assembly factor-like uncharacterized protein